MSVHSIWPYFLVAALACCLISLPAFRSIDPPAGAEHGRTTHIDGIRGLLALSVMIDHAVVTHRWLTHGEWVVPPAKFYDQLGTLSVAVFFMITGFLFWGRMVRAQGRIGFASLYINRLFRIAPVYLLAVAMMVLIVFARSDFTLRQPLPVVLRAIGEWASLGLLGAPDFNGYAGAWIVLAGVTWTLKWEWYFYFSLRVTGPLAARAAAWLPGAALPAFLLAAQMWPAPGWYYASLFACGMLVATVPPGVAAFLGRRDRLSSVVALALLVGIFAGWSTPWGTPQVLLAAGFFVLVCNGTSLFGLLRTRSAHRLGHVSYSIYLLQGIVLTLVFSAGPVRDKALGSAPLFWATVAACAVLLVALAAAVYVLVERPGIAAGKRLVRWWERSPKALVPRVT
jgi:peptidoglycan/LPS O-acetylase OafA/YrhL